MFTRLLAGLVLLALSGATAHATIIKIFGFNVDGVLPSADPQIELFVASPSATETEVYSVSGGLLRQRTLAEVGNYSYSFPDASLTGGGLDPAKSLMMEARLRILGIQGVDGVFFQAFDGRRYGPTFDQTGLVFFDAQRRGPSVDLSHLDLSEFHTYRVESPGNSAEFDFFVDNALVFSGIAANNCCGFNGFEWGDGFSTPGNGADVDWDYVRFFQPSSGIPPGQLTPPGCSGLAPGRGGSVPPGQLSPPGCSGFAPGQLSAVPIPAALPLFLTALAGLGLLGWRRRQTA